MRIFDVHLHIQPWEMVRPDVLRMIDDPSHADARDVLASAESTIRFLDDNEIERACCINYVSPDVMVEASRS